MSKSQMKRLAAQRGKTVCTKCYGACLVTDGQTGETIECSNCDGRGEIELVTEGGREGSGVEGSCIPKSGCGCN